MREINSTLNFNKIPVTTDLNVKALVHIGEIITRANGEIVFNDEWIYVYLPHYGCHSINVIRSQYCEKRYLMNVSIISQSGGKMTKRLQDFTVQVSPNLVFEKDGITYRVFLKKTKGGFDLDYVRFYWLISHSANSTIADLPKKYIELSKPVNPLNYAHTLEVDLKKAFGYEN